MADRGPRSMFDEPETDSPVPAGYGRLDDGMPQPPAPARERKPFRWGRTWKEGEEPDDDPAALDPTGPSSTWPRAVAAAPSGVARPPASTGRQRHDDDDDLIDEHADRPTPEPRASVGSPVGYARTTDGTDPDEAAPPPSPSPSPSPSAGPSAPTTSSAPSAVAGVDVDEAPAPTRAAPSGTSAAPVAKSATPPPATPTRSAGSSVASKSPAAAKSATAASAGAAAVAPTKATPAKATPTEKTSARKAPAQKAPAKKAPPVARRAPEPEPEPEGLQPTRRSRLIPTRVPRRPVGSDGRILDVDRDGTAQPEARPAAYLKETVRTRQVVRHVDTFTVFRASLLFYFLGVVSLLLAGVVLWNVASALGTIHSINKSIKTLFDLKSFTLHPLPTLGYAAAGGAVLMIFGTLINVLACVIFNLISDVSGGIVVRVVSEPDDD